MKLYTSTKEPVKFIEVKNLRSKEDKPFTVVAFGNPSTFERFEFFANDSLDLKDISPSDNLQLVIDASRSGYNNRYNLVAVRKLS